jgi:hypothetical protein
LGQDLDAFSKARYPQEQIPSLQAAAAALVPHTTFAITSTPTEQGEFAFLAVFPFVALLLQMTLVVCVMRAALVTATSTLQVEEPHGRVSRTPAMPR